jgi:mono/diheme cytochrome c family protein
MTFFRFLLLAFVVLVVLGAGGFGFLAWKPALPPAAVPEVGSFDPSLVRQGATLAAMGDCTTCHSLPGKPAFSGGVPIETPFGTIYSSNITPDAETGIGQWSEAALQRSMREGLDREGRHLYPAFPYDHFTLVSDEDNRALYAYLMTREPAKAKPPANSLIFPLNIRALIAGWKFLFFHRGPWQRDARRDPAWNRGAYLVEGLGHCGACHTPRNGLGAERNDAHLGGGTAEGWNAYALNAASPAPIPWSVDALASYLEHGWQEHHGVSRGPMAAVTANLAAIPQADLSAMSTYLVSLMDVPSQERRNRAKVLLDREDAERPPASAGSQVSTPAPDTSAGAAIYVGACASCHESGRPQPFGGLNLAMSTATHAPDPTNIVLVTLNGLPAAPGEASPIMPGFSGTLTDDRIVKLLAYLRETIAKEAGWPDLERIVREARIRAMTLHASDGTSAAPADTSTRVTKW